jgi:hypothetical protein
MKRTTKVAVRQGFEILEATIVNLLMARDFWV